jgi:omega-amidase
MKIAIIQVATQLGQPQKNKITLESYLNHALPQKIDTVIFPETWNIGFFPEDPVGVAEDVERSESLQWMKEYAKHHSINIVGGSIAIKEQGKLFNRCYIINRQGEVVYYYNKAHLFSPGKEPDFFTPGDQNELFELDGIPCAVQICYDLRFPELARTQALDGAKILFVPAQWPHPRCNHWVSLNKARAIENQLFVVSNNGCGSAGPLKSCGHSAVFDPWGEELLLFGEDEGSHVITLNLQAVDEVRSKIPVFKDRLPHLYKAD